MTAGTWVKYAPGGHTVDVVCKACGQLVASIMVAHRPPIIGLN
jgi:hypothetical protein